MPILMMALLALIIFGLIGILLTAATVLEHRAHAHAAQGAAGHFATTAAATAVGQKVTLSGTFDSYTPKPLMIVMSDGAVVLAKKAPAKAPVHHTAPHK